MGIRHKRDLHQALVIPKHTTQNERIYFGISRAARELYCRRNNQIIVKSLALCLTLRPARYHYNLSSWCVEVGYTHRQKSIRVEAYTELLHRVIQPTKSPTSRAGLESSTARHCAFRGQVIPTSLTCPERKCFEGHLTCMMESSCAKMDLWQSLKSRPQILMFLSAEPETSSVLSEEMSIVKTGSLCPYRLPFSFNVSKNRIWKQRGLLMAIEGSVPQRDCIAIELHNFDIPTVGHLTKTNSGCKMFKWQCNGREMSWSYGVSLFQLFACWQWV